ncbi:hypothetical protein C5167_035046 [Papaver somniferum]|uniref:Uncharacterized protein n=1 Tax=Papaver somniferum TaxID=3469 RepID=A0A4Y7KIS8_PAPSO|nr:hypothetical protein C5167_035046 [Papaver somniferum]
MTGARSTMISDPLVYTKASHVRVAFSDDGPLGKVKYAVTCYAKGFEALRRTYCPSELDSKALIWKHIGVLQRSRGLGFLPRMCKWKCDAGRLGLFKSIPSIPELDNMKVSCDTRPSNHELAVVIQDLQITTPLPSLHWGNHVLPPIVFRADAIINISYPLTS